MTGDTPATLKGARVIDVPALEALMPQRPLLIDVGPADRKPDGLRSSTVWKPTHRSIPGAVWFPGAGSADLPDEKVEALLRRIAELTNGDKSALVVTFCRPKCWGSWNIGKRLVQAGYTSVHWLPAGVSGWQERNDTTAVTPETGGLQKPSPGRARRSEALSTRAHAAAENVACTLGCRAGNPPIIDAWDAARIVG